ncbi:metabolite transport protein csbC-related protein [Trichomonas vaginalis G3]|uniref:Metabolite transport protein csbC-related protein n=1 Tax=Trichomonas vaginalis (strain ATCC PRA-98 / G3) TaxID=412133 RepID=A2G525_TRIV3|nr:glucose import [Trichomonas vaginalis G3]EAX87744.1 metabolite transport protein csbC-related protein [Trichomonas vaginalis G3]KAI5506748.1 glucose import [Trichomonas vaginalis G3]|eukprot:XP_001300674.1 metabolite transport protein csbC-related protein [Trichomonas vaginalis G3]
MGICGKHLLYALPSVLTPFTFGYIVGYTSPALPYYQEKFPDLTSFEVTIFNAITSLLACFGPYLTTFLFKFFGRRVVTVILDVANIILWACLFSITTKKLYYFGIFICALLGIILGACSAIGPLYLVEVAPPEYGGFFGSMNQMSIVLVSSFYSALVNIITRGLFIFLPSLHLLSKLPQFGLSQRQLLKRKIMIRKMTPKMISKNQSLINNTSRRLSL